VNNLEVIYLQELKNVNDICKNYLKLPKTIKNIICIIKQIFGIITIKENGICILPYKTLKKYYKLKIFFIKNFLKKHNVPIVFSKYLDSVHTLKDDIIKSNFKVIDGKRLSNYITLEIIEYICKMIDKKIENQDITILIQNDTVDIRKMIVEIAKQVKRIQIVTTQINKFKTIENELEFKYGLSCQITNNKRKSLLKSKIIVNIDYSENELNQFIINKQAIIIDINNKNEIYAKSFIGIHIYEYNITSNIKNNTFDVKNIIEAISLNKTYEQTRNLLKKENVKVVNLVGKNGLINNKEYTRVCR
jgi:hypothetical protein